MNAPLRKLLWKEWREGRWLYLVPVVVAVLWAVLARIDPTEFVLVLAPLPVFFYCLLGARAYASEVSRGTDGFLFALPVRPGYVVRVKTILPLTALLVALGLSAMVVIPSFADHISCDRKCVFPVIGAMWLLGHAGAFAAFGTCLFLGALLEHPTTATALGMAVAAAEAANLEPLCQSLNSRAAFDSPMGISLGAALLIIQGVVFLGLAGWYLSPRKP